MGGGLILTRHKGEKVSIGADIVVTVLRIGPHNVQLHFQAPKNIPILRDDAIDVAQHVFGFGRRDDSD